MALYFISDLHLDDTRPAIANAFLSLLKGRATECDALYILGDLFEVWLGDDDETTFHDGIIEGLAGLTASGVGLFIMHGNRDFLIGSRFCAQTGAQLLEDPLVIDCFGRSVLLMHGDSLCTRDKRYMQVRAQMRDPGFQQGFLGKPIAERAEFARQVRMESMERTSSTDAGIMDVTPDEVTRVMHEHGVDLLIHGHTHRPKVHELMVGDRPATRVVLGDWGDEGWILEFEPDGFELQSFPIHSLS